MKLFGNWKWLNERIDDLVAKTDVLQQFGTKAANSTF
ncbi:hypothetical protein ABIB62_003263 [Mucilaginibacter sp. UYP25]